LTFFSSFSCSRLRRPAHGVERRGQAGWSGLTNWRANLFGRISTKQKENIELQYRRQFFCRRIKKAKKAGEKGGNDRWAKYKIAAFSKEAALWVRKCPILFWTGFSPGCHFYGVKPPPRRRLLGFKEEVGGVRVLGDRLSQGNFGSSRAGQPPLPPPPWVRGENCYERLHGRRVEGAPHVWRSLTSSSSRSFASSSRAVSAAACGGGGTGRTTRPPGHRTTGAPLRWDGTEGG